MSHSPHIANPELARRFPEIHPPFASQEALIEANRCLYCFDAPCSSACPTHIDVPRFIKKIAQQNLAGSALTILDANVLGASCSRVCPVEVLCEGACVYHRYNKEPIQIGRLQRHAMDHFYISGQSLPQNSVPMRPEKIACIGAGPASLSCAAELRRQGFSVTIFESRQIPGGLNTYGVAEYKLRAPDSLREIEMIRGLGVHFRFGESISGEAPLSKLESEFALIFVGVGLGAMHRLKIPGEDSPGVVNALEFIERYKTTSDHSVGEKVVVVGAGNTAIDAARAALRLGAKEVHLLYRRDRPLMSAFSWEYEQAHEEGIQFHWFTQPVAVYCAKTGKGIESMECARVRTNAQGALEPIPNSNFLIPCDMVIPAIGQSHMVEFLESTRGIRVEEGRIQIDRATGQTSHPRYFAGGDCVNGGREVVDAVADGKRAALGMAKSLGISHV